MVLDLDSVLFTFIWLLLYLPNLLGANQIRSAVEIVGKPKFVSLALSVSIPARFQTPRALQVVYNAGQHFVPSSKTAQHENGTISGLPFLLLLTVL